MVGELVTLEPSVLDSDKMIDSLVVNDALPVIEREMTSVVGVSVDSGVDEGVKVGESLSADEGTAFDVILALPPKEMGDGGVSDGEVLELVIILETLGLAVGETVLEPVDESEFVSALDGDCKLEGVCVKDGIISDDEGVSEDDKLEEMDAVTLGETVLLGVDDVDAPKVTEVVGEFDKDELTLGVDSNDSEPVLVIEAVLETEAIGVTVIDVVGEDVMDCVLDVEGVGVGESLDD